MKKITILDVTISSIGKPKQNLTTYVKESISNEDQFTILEVQRKYYKSLIETNEEW